MTLYPLLFPLEFGTPGWLFALTVLAIIALLAAIIVSRKKENGKNAALNNVLQSLDGFEPTDSVKSTNLKNFYYFAVDDTRDKVFFYTEYTYWLFHYHNILSVSIRLGDFETISYSFGEEVRGVKSIVVHVPLCNMPDSNDRTMDIVCYDSEQGMGQADEASLTKYYDQARKIEQLLTRAMEKVEESNKRAMVEQRSSSSEKKAIHEAIISQDEEDVEEWENEEDDEEDVSAATEEPRLGFFSKLMLGIAGARAIEAAERHFEER